MKRIKELRKMKGISQQALADILHVTQQSVYKYENDLAQPEIDILIKCARYFDVSVDYLIEFSDVCKRYEVEIDNAITRDEFYLLEYYRRLSSRSKEFIQEVIQKPDN